MSDYLTNCDPGDETDELGPEVLDDEYTWFERRNIEECEAAARRYGYKDNDEMTQAMGC